MRTLLFLFLLPLLLLGCNPSPSGAKKGDGEIRQAFTELQKAVAAKDADKIWELLNLESRSDAEREAKAVKEAYARLPDKEKASYETQFKLTGKELGELTGKHYVKSQRFYGKHHELPESTLKTIDITGDSAKMVYEENDADHDRETLHLTRENGQWKFALPIPKATP
jgi:hypothetical protein